MDYSIKNRSIYEKQEKIFSVYGIMNGGRREKMELNFKSRSRFFAEVALIASLYIVMTVLMPFSYNNVQFRISEALMVLVLFRRSSIPGLILGCFIANLFSPFGLPDIIFGTLGTALAVYGIYRLREKKPVVALIPGVLANGLLVGLELWFFANIPFIAAAGFVSIGEFLVLYTLGIAFYWALKKIRFPSDYENVF